MDLKQEQRGKKTGRLTPPLNRPSHRILLLHYVRRLIFHRRESGKTERKELEKIGRENKGLEAHHSFWVQSYIERYSTVAILLFKFYLRFLTQSLELLKIQTPSNSPTSSQSSDLAPSTWLIGSSKLEEMLMGRTDGLPELNSQKELLLPDRISELEDDEEAGSSSQILYTASFDELGRNFVQYDTVIWLSISLLLVLAWGVGIIMLLYLPIKRYILEKDISSRKLYVTPTEIVYKVSRPSFIPFWGVANTEKRVPLSSVIDVIIEQGCLQSVYGIHTIRIESISSGRAAPVDELQVQGISNPRLLRKAIIKEAAKVIQDSGRTLRFGGHTSEVDISTYIPSFMEGTTALRSPSKNWKVTSSPRVSSVERGIASGDVLLHRLDEMNRSLKRIESLIVKPQADPECS